MTTQESRTDELILVVTVNDLLASGISDALESDYKLLRARSYAEALSSMTFNLPVIIISDLDLPDKSGIDLLQSIRKSIKTKLIPFIILSPDYPDSIQTRITALEKGADDHITYPFLAEELKVVVKSKLSKFREFYLLSITDELTRLFNRREFIKKFNLEIQRSDERTLSLAILDIDYFKSVNDKYGHQMGDKVLMTLAEMLKKRTSDNFFPARFGGEEFVVLFPDTDSVNSQHLIEDLLEEFSSYSFEINRQTFSITFSAGISEYPYMASGVSELLTRSDQALYAAKEDGRNRIYIFSPIMARNDKFWEYLKTGKGLFVNELSNDPVTELPYLPQLLEVISNLDFDVMSIGALIIKLYPVDSFESYYGEANYEYDLQNIKLSIRRSCELIFPSDTYIGISDFFKYELTILFPSVVDFTFNLKKFNEMCREIANSICSCIEEYYIDISYASGVISLDRTNPKKIYKDLDIIRKEEIVLSQKNQKCEETLALFKSFNRTTQFTDFFEIRNYYDTTTLTKSFHFLSMKKEMDIKNTFGSLMVKSIDSLARIKDLMTMAGEALSDNLSRPILINLPLKFILEEPEKLIDFSELASSSFINREIVYLINEHQVLQMISDSRNMILNELPENISLGINNCYINNEILANISLFDFKFLLLSENITRNIYMFKNRIKIINGLQIFLEQVGIPMFAKNIRTEDEYQIIRDLNISYFSGDFAESIAVD